MKERTEALKNNMEGFMHRLRYLTLGLGLALAGCSAGNAGSSDTGCPDYPPADDQDCDDVVAADDCDDNDSNAADPNQGWYPDFDGDGDGEFQATADILACTQTLAPVTPTAMLLSR